MIEQRRAKRFELELPVEIVRSGSAYMSTVGMTRNISSGGILFVGERTMEIGGPVEYVVTLAAGTQGVVSLRCVGKVLRQQKKAAEEPEAPLTTFAVSLERWEFQRSNSHPQMNVV
jgi:hypothetical protein